MINLRKKHLFIVLLVMIFILNSCSSNEHESTQTSDCIIDCSGRKVTLPENPQRIAALDSFSGEALVMIGAGSKLVSVPNGVKSDTILQEICPELKDTSVHMSGGAINVEALMLEKPDLALIKGSIYLNGGEVKKLEKAGIPYLVVDYSTMEEQMFALSMIGDAIGGEAGEKARSINNYYKSVIDKANAISTLIPDESRFKVYHSINEFVRTDGLGTLGYDWITCAGAINVSTGDNMLSDGSDFIATVEQIFAWNPDIIICNDAETAEYLNDSDRWQGLSAVRDGQVYNIPIGATRWGQRGSLETFFAILWLGTTIYPEYYKDIDLKTEVVQFYKEYLDLDIDDDGYLKILTGIGIRAGSQNSGS